MVNNNNGWFNIPWTKYIYIYIYQKHYIILFKNKSKKYYSHVYLTTYTLKNKYDKIFLFLIIIMKFIFYLSLFIILIFAIIIFSGIFDCQNSSRNGIKEHKKSGNSA